MDTSIKKNSYSMPYDEYASQIYKKDPELLAELLKESLEEGEIEEFLQHLQIAVKTFGSISEIAQKTGLHEKTLYKSLSIKGNPTIKTLVSVMNSLGLTFTIQTKEKSMLNS